MILITEANLVKRIRAKLKKEVGGFWVSMGGGLYRTVGLPDIVGVYKGRFIGLEVKLPGKENTLTERQKFILKEIELNGGIAEMVTSVDEAIDVINKNISRL